MAAALFRLPSFVEWPDESFPEPQPRFKLCVVGKNAVFDLLARHKGETTKGRPFDFSLVEQLSDADGCHLIFLPGEIDGLGFEEVRRLCTKRCLTVSDTPHFARQGGMIRMFFRQRKLRFEINLNAAQKAGLVVSSRLLALATIVESD